LVSFQFAPLQAVPPSSLYPNQETGCGSSEPALPNRNWGIGCSKLQFCPSTYRTLKNCAVILSRDSSRSDCKCQVHVSEFLFLSAEVLCKELITSPPQMAARRE
jgi:hypothetical protein